MPNDLASALANSDLLFDAAAMPMSSENTTPRKPISPRRMSRIHSDE